ncbi:PHD and RING finger domain-containing protein 1 [Halotydeus destructor]|nr:PHD and RING finger domain-containing protein 1 [Halotydeus destructor]
MDKDAENEKENQEMRMTDCDNHSVNDECMSSAEDDETDIDVPKDGDDEEDDLHENSSTEGEDAGENEEDTLDAKSPEGDRCPICLNCLSLGQDIGTPDSCEGVHHFCLDCIEEWSANVNTCPVDRKEFHVILVQRELLGSIIERLTVTNRLLQLSHENNVVHHEDLTYCEICGRCDHEDTLLLCDNCDFGYHCHCLNPPLDRVPIEEWYCPDCSESMFGTSDFNSTLQELNRLRRARGSRAIARTGASELVRSRIERRRLHPEDNLTDTY